jgi:hypothetical protein
LLLDPAAADADDVVRVREKVEAVRDEHLRERVGLR